MTFSLRHILVGGATLALGTMPETLFATENAALHYSLGVNTFYAAVMPGPNETWIQGYSFYYPARKFAGADGGDLVPGFKSTVIVNAARVFHGWDAQIGPFQLSSAIVVPVVYTSIGNSSGSESNFGVGDIALQPLYLGWSNQDRTLFAFATAFVWVPTGNEVSTNTWSFNPNMAMTWLPTPKLELSFVAGLEFSTENTKTDYQSGSLFYLDWGVNYRAFDMLPQVTVGLGGYVVKQFTDDELRGNVFQGGFRQQGFAIGPQIGYSTKNGGFIVKWQHEFETENRVSGDQLYFQWSIPIGQKSGG